jgi:hypothetical protein
VKKYSYFLAAMNAPNARSREMAPELSTAVMLFSS